MCCSRSSCRSCCRSAATAALPRRGARASRRGAPTGPQDRELRRHPAWPASERERRSSRAERRRIGKMTDWQLQVNFSEPCKVTNFSDAWRPLPISPTHETCRRVSLERQHLVRIWQVASRAVSWKPAHGCQEVIIG
jgi:hypothetical protein